MKSQFYMRDLCVIKELYFLVNKKLELLNVMYKIFILKFMKNKTSNEDRLYEHHKFQAISF